MEYQPFPIADFKTGEYGAKEPWLSPKDSFEVMENAYVHRGAIKKRKGSEVAFYAVSRVGTLAGGATDFQKGDTEYANVTADTVVVELTGHGLSTGDYIVIQGVTGTNASALNDKRFFVECNDTNLNLDADHFILDDVTYSGLGLDGTTQDGTIDQIKCLSKKEQISASGITQSNPAGVTTPSANGLSTGDKVRIVEEEGSAIAGMEEIINVASTVTVLDSTRFALDNVDSTNYNAHTSGGTVALIDEDADPIVGLSEYRKADGTLNLVIATTKRLSYYTGSLSNAQALSTSDQFTGDNTQFFQFSNFGDKLYFTNFQDAPFEWSGSGTPSAHNFNSTGVTKARLFLVYKQRLLVLNTVESGNNFSNRARWSSVLTSATPNPDWDAGSAIDAATQEAIVGAKFLKDTLIVFFELSTWALKDTGSADIPFRWEKIDDLSTLIDAQHSVIGHQNSVWGFGRAGWILSDSFQVKTFNTPIPDFQDKIDPGLRSRLYSARNIAEDQIWMAFNKKSNSDERKSLIYNTQTPSFSEFDLDYNVASEFNKDTTGDTWADFDFSWEDAEGTWSDSRELEGFPGFFLGDNCGAIIRANMLNSSDDGANINLKLLSNRLVPFPDGQSQLGWIDFLVTSNDNTTLDINVYSDWDPNCRVCGVMDLDDNFAGQEKKWYRFYVNMIAPSFRFEFSHNQPHEIVIHAIIPHFRKAGRLT